MSRWDDLIGEPRATLLRMMLCEAATIAHTENAARFDPDELGDDALWYGISTTASARHIATRLIEDAGVEGVAVCVRGRVWWLEVQRDNGAAVRVYFYKAPPGKHRVQDLRLDDTEIKKELSSSNGIQLALFNRSGGEGNADLLNVLVVHFGDPLTGLEKLDVGAPYLLNSEVAWDWDEPFSVSADMASDSAPVSVTELGDDDAGYAGLSLVPDLPEEADAPGGDVVPDALPEQATSEFTALGMKDENLEEDDTDQGTSQES